MLDKETGIFRHHTYELKDPASINSNTLYDIYKDSHERIWITGKGGISRLVNKDGKFENITKSSGLISEIITSILEDNNQNLWLGTIDKGIIKFNPKTNEFKTYKKEDGLPGNSIFWTARGKTSDGRLWFGGKNGAFSFHPEKIKNNPNSPEIFLTSFKQGGREVLLDKAPEIIKEIALDWNENYFEFQFTALNFSKPHKNQYAYMLEGRDTDWYSSGYQPFGRYTGLQGGSYLLKLKGSNNDGIWSNNETLIKIIIKPPFWRSQWFYFTIACLCLGLIGFVMAYLRKLKREIKDRKQAEKKVLESEKKYRDLIDNTPDLRYRTDLDGRIVFVSPSVKRLSGYSVEEALGMKMAEEIYVYPDERNEFLQKLQENGSITDFEAQLKQKNGSIWWASTNAHFQKDEKGNILGVEGVTRDITDRKKAEDDRIKNEKDLKESQRIAHLGSWRVNMETNEVFWTAELYKMYGFDPTLPPPPYTEHMKLFKPDSWQLLSTSQEKTSETGIPYELELETVKENGSEGWVWVRGEAVKNSAGNTIGLWGAAQDITERKRNEEKLKLQSGIITRMSEGISMVNKDSIIVYTNPAFEKMFGYDPGEMLGLHVSKLNAPIEKDPEETAEEILKSLNLTGNWVGEIQNIKKDGTSFWGAANVTILEHPKYGKAFISVQTDISELKQAKDEKKKLENKLQQAQKMESIGNLAGGIAHDFNNLLFPIIGMSEMLLEDLPKDSLEYENAEEIFQAGKRAGDLVNQILAFSRQSEHKMSPVRVQNVLKEVLKLSRSTIPSNIEIQQNIQQDCGLVMADPTQIHQIGMNLITNAFHAIEGKNGTIDIELKEITLKDNELSGSDLQPEQYIKLSVSDNGIGMSADTIQKIFEPYFTTKEKGKGTGLGLAVLYGIVKEHKGEINVYSELGKGTAFNVYLPLMKKLSEVTAVDKMVRAETGTERILLVDDEVSVAKLESQILSRLGYRVTVKTASNDALNTFKENPNSFDLVISDMTMPDMTGDKLAKKILSIRPETPIVICTGFSERLNKEQAEIIGVKGFLMKPVAKSDMAQMIRNVLDEVKKR